MKLYHVYMLVLFSYVYFCTNIADIFCIPVYPVCMCVCVVTMAYSVYIMYICVCVFQC